MSLPLVLQTTLQTIPLAIPYLRADPFLASQWRARMKLGSNPKVGLVWTGRPTHPNNRYRSVEPKDLATLATMDNIDWFNLQLPASLAADARQFIPQLQLIDETADIQDFADTAAIIENLDLVLTIDTAVAHLAGAMGKTVWLFFPFRPDWRWACGGIDSPWYSTMRFFRQTTPGDWSPPIAEIAAALRSFKTRSS